MKVIEDLKSQVTNANADKKLAENLLKSALLQNEMSKENKIEKKPSTAILHSMENGRVNNGSNKQINIGVRVKTDNYLKKKIETETYEDETDYPSHAPSQPLNTSFLGLTSKVSLDEKSKDARDINMSMNFEKLSKMMDGNTITTLVTEESDEPFPNKVSPPKLNNKSLKERMDMNQFRLDLTRLSKNRKVE